MPDIRDDDSLTSAQSLTAGRTRVRAYPYPALGGFFTKPPVGKELKLPVGPPLRVDHLDSRQVGV